MKTLCQRLDLIHCVDPLARRALWGDPSYFRLHGRGSYHYKYSAGELREPLHIARESAAVYILFNNSAMWDDARRFLALL